MPRRSQAERLAHIEAMLEQMLGPREIPEEKAWEAFLWLGNHTRLLSEDTELSDARRSVCRFVSTAIINAVKNGYAKK